MKPEERPYPKLPSALTAPGGDVRILLRQKAKADGEDVWGSWDENTRVITLDSTATIRHQWKTFYHEAAHAALSDAGTDELVTEQVVEAICDAIATARMRERFG